VHRGIEKGAEDRNWIQNMYLVERVCGICSHVHATALALGVEKLAGVTIPPRAQAIRTLTAELERVHSHMLWLGVCAHEGGFDTLFMYSWRDRETVMDLLEQLTGNRVNYSVNVLGGVKVDVSQAQIDAFNAYIDHNSYLSKHRGQIASRNASNSPWVNQLDLGLQQELPGFFGKDKFVVRMDIYNFLNLLNKKWGDVENAGFFGTRNLVSSATTANGQYVYNLSKPPANYTLYDSYTNPSRVVSRWQILFTLRYKF